MTPPASAHAPLEALLGTSAAASADRGIVHQLLVDLGTSSSTAHTVQVYAVAPLRILLIVAIAFVATRLVSRASQRIITSLRLVSPLVRATPRGSDRARTLAGVTTSLLKAIIWVVALLTVLAELRIDLAPFVATATVIGAAVGFGAQTLVKDFLSGVLILAEDQYGVGDSITIASSGTQGVVESVNLRTTRVRSLDGMVWYVPNGDIRAVGNTTERESAALVDVAVPHGTDLAAAGRAAEAAAQALAQRPEWDGVILAPPAFLGVQASDNEGATLRLIAQTSPGGHFSAGRALRMAVLEQLRLEGLAWAPEGTPPPAVAIAAERAAPDPRAAAAQVASSEAVPGPGAVATALPAGGDLPGIRPTPRAAQHAPFHWRERWRRRRLRRRAGRPPAPGDS